MTEKLPIHLEMRGEGVDLRQFSPSAARNAQPIVNIVKDYLPINSRVLEIASGTGEQAVAICQARLDISWQPSDPDERSRQSQNAWRSECGDQILPSLEINTTEDAWWKGLGEFEVLYCANMIHIAPWEAALGMAGGASKLINPEGMVILYGPYLEGDKTADSNFRFDENLKARNPLWGVRSLDSVKHMFADVGFNLRARIEMPAENRILVFSRS